MNTHMYVLYFYNRNIKTHKHMSSSLQNGVIISGGKYTILTVSVTLKISVYHFYFTLYPKTERPHWQRGHVPMGPKPMGCPWPGPLWKLMGTGRPSIWKQILRGGTPLGINVSTKTCQNIRSLDLGKAVY